MLIFWRASQNGAVLHSAPFARLPLQGNRKGTGAAASIYSELSAVLVQIGDGRQLQNR